MDPIVLLKALILGIVEGVTEFLPISSTGHLILVGELLDFNDEKGKVFEIAIQLAAILAVCWEYRVKLIEVLVGLTSKQDAQRFILNLFIAFLTAAILGLLFVKIIKQYLFHAVPVAMAFIVGGLLILWAERRVVWSCARRMGSVAGRDGEGTERTGGRPRRRNGQATGAEASSLAGDSARHAV